LSCLRARRIGDGFARLVLLLGTTRRRWIVCHSTWRHRVCTFASFKMSELGCVVRNGGVELSICEGGGLCHSKWQRGFDCLQLGSIRRRWVRRHWPGLPLTVVSVRSPSCIQLGALVNSALRCWAECHCCWALVVVWLRCVVWAGFASPCRRVFAAVAMWVVVSVWGSILLVAGSGG